MSRTRRMRIITNLIDADGCTFNSDYRKRILLFIHAYHKVLQEYGSKSPLSQAEKILIDIFIKNAIEEQKRLTLQKEAVREATEYAQKEAKIFYEKQLLKNGENEADIKAKLTSATDSFLLNNFLFHLIQSMENICPYVLRTIFILSNKRLIDKIHAQVKQGAKVILISGSNRQSYLYDQINMKSKGTSSIFRELQFLTQYINSNLQENKVTLEKFTLPDLYEVDEFKPGKNFKKILKSLEPYVNNAFCARKVNILYAVMHYITQKHPVALHTFNLIDDQVPILADAKTFFATHPDLFLKATKLNLYKYTGKFSTVWSVCGVGEIDHFFVQNTRLMAEMCGFDKGTNSEVNIAQVLDVKKFREQRMKEKSEAGGTLTLFQKIRSSIEPLEGEKSIALTK